MKFASRLVLAGVLFGLFAVPLLLPGLDIWRYPSSLSAWDEMSRLLALAQNTILLVVGTLVVAMPLGIFVAVLLDRSDLPLQRPLKFVVVLTLFVPLPLVASAWQATLGSGGWLAAGFWNSPVEWRPWAVGFLPAIWVHAMAALPWVIWLVGQGLRRVEGDLEEDALLAAGPWRVLWTVSLARSKAALGAAALWVALQTATEITVTDIMQVHTFAEEVYTQFVRQDEMALGRAVAVSLPSVGLIAILVLAVAAWWERTLPPLQQVTPPVLLFRLGKARWPLLVVMLAGIAILAAVPVASLAWKAGLHGAPETWSLDALGDQLAQTYQSKSEMLFENLLLALLAGVSAAALALASCWLASGSRGFQYFVLVLAACAWAMPAPVVGIGLKETINRLLDLEEGLEKTVGIAGIGPLRVMLYEGPSVAPILWASVLRFFPCAVAVLWPAVRQLPRELGEAAQLDGVGPIGELMNVVAPLTARAWKLAALAVGVLSLGELGAGKLVETPGSTTFAHAIFEQMHRGVPPDVAGHCLLLLVVVAVGGGCVAVTGKRER